MRSFLRSGACRHAIRIRSRAGRAPRYAPASGRSAAFSNLRVPPCQPGAAGAARDSATPYDAPRRRLAASHRLCRSSRLLPSQQHARPLRASAVRTVRTLRRLAAYREDRGYARETAPPLDHPSFETASARRRTRCRGRCARGRASPARMRRAARWRSGEPGRLSKGRHHARRSHCLLFGLRRAARWPAGGGGIIRPTRTLKLSGPL